MFSHSIEYIARIGCDDVDAGPTGSRCSKADATLHRMGPLKDDVYWTGDDPSPVHVADVGGAAPSAAGKPDQPELNAAVRATGPNGYLTMQIGVDGSRHRPRFRCVKSLRKLKALIA
jgi:hypothetical protein